MPQSEKWTGVILAGGLGTRLNPLTAKICKPMVPVTNRPMIDYAIDHLRYAGIKRIIVCVKKFGDKLTALIRKNWPQEFLDEIGLEIIIPNNDSKGTADAVRLVSQYIETENFVVSMADIVTNLPMADFMDFHEKKNAYATVSMKKIEEMATKYGNTLLDENNRIIRFLEKPSSEEIYLSALTGGAQETLPIINTGIYCFKREVLDLLEENRFIDFGHEVFPFLLEHNYDLYGFVRNYYWMDVGNPTTYLWCNWDMLRLYGWPIQPSGVRQGEESFTWYENNEKPPEYVKHEDHICLGTDIKFGKNVYIGKLTTIGSHVEIGENVSISRAVIWDNVKIGNNVKIEEAIIANGVTIEDGAIIRGSAVIGPDAHISPGITIDAEIVKEDETR